MGAERPLDPTSPWSGAGRRAGYGVNMGWPRHFQSTGRLLMGARRSERVTESKDWMT